MKKALKAGFLLSAALCASVTFAAENKVETDTLNLAGDYKCTGYDSHDGYFTGNVTLQLDGSASDFDNNFGSYKFTLKADVSGTAANYSGFAAASGNSLAIYFENDDAKHAATDRGVAIASVAHDQDRDGKFTTSISKFYYLPEYKRDAKDGKGPGGRGTEHCIKTK